MPENTGNDGVFVTVVILADGFARNNEFATVLDVAKTNESTTHPVFGGIPTCAHSIKRGCDLENRRLGMEVDVVWRATVSADEGIRANAA